MNEPRYLIDSNILIYILADAHSPSALRMQTMSQGSVVTSSIAFAEVMRGYAGADDTAAAKACRLFEIVEVLPFDAAAAERYARLPFRRGSFDRLIAAHALSSGLTLVTANERDFADVEGLRIANWSS